MAFDKVVDSSVLDSGLSQIADAIREKGGTTDELIFPSGFTTAIEGISSGGDTSVEDGLIDRTLTGEYTNDRVTTVGEHAFRGISLSKINLPNVTNIGAYSFYSAQIESVDFQNVTSIGDQAFRSCDKLTSVTLPKISTCSGYSFMGCTNLVEINIPNVTTLNISTFEDCKSLKEVYFPNITTVGNRIFANCYELIKAILPNVTSVSTAMFYYSKKLVSVDLSSATSISSSGFQSCSVLTRVIIRNTTSACSLANKNAFTSTPIASGTGYIYVPSTLVDTYKSATNWSTYASQFRALEDYTVDGTITGELDESKI